MKKILTVILSFAMVLCMIPGMAFAEDTPTTPINGAAITFAQSSYEYTGSAVEPKVAVTLNGALLNQNTDYTVTYSNNIESAAATAAAPPTVTVTGKGNYSGNMTATFTITPKDIGKVVLTHPEAFPIGTKITDIDFVLKNGSVPLNKGVDYTVSFKDASQSEIKQGSQEVIVTGQKNYTGSRTIPVNGGTDIKTFVVDPIKEVTYNGTAQNPSVIVRSAANAPALSTSYYDVTYSNNTNAGTATVTITGKNGYAGTLTATFTIVPKSIERATVSSIENQAISGVPEPTVYDGSKKLKLGEDYRLSYKNHEQKGTATVYITGIGNYNKETSRTYQVKDSLNSYAFSLLKTTYEYTGNTIKPEVLVAPSFKYREGVDYKLVYDNNSKVEENKKVQIVGIGNYGGIAAEFIYSITRKEITEKNSTLSIPSETYTYAGKAIEPHITITCGGKTLQKDVDYTITYLNNNRIGVASIIVYGTGNYTGSLNKSFRIVGKDLSQVTGSLEKDSYAYDGLEKKPMVTLYDGSKKLTNGVDYTLAYKNNKNAGTAEVIVTGKGNYGGTKTLTFRIVGKSQLVTTRYTRYSKTLNSKAFNLLATNDGDGTLVYSSDNPSVAKVSADGTVTIMGTGIAKITVSTTGNVKYDPASKVVYVTVKPLKPVVKLTTPAKKQIKVTFTKVEGTTKYQIRYGRMGKYYNKYITHRNNEYTKTYTTLKNRVSGKTYYIKVRAYKELEDGTRIYGDWSPVQKIKAK